MSTDPSTLHQFDGRPVPWITRWTHEVVEPTWSLTLTREGARAAYKDGNEDRDSRGVLWQREGLSRGGEPQWANVSTYRQRSSMRRNLCQVCGTKIIDRPIPWIMPTGGLEFLDDRALTVQAPTCPECVDLALTLCPYLKAEGYQILNVLEYKIWGVSGEVLVTDPEGKPRRVSAAVGYEEDYGEGFSLGRVIAKQQIVELTKYVVR